MGRLSSMRIFSVSGSLRQSGERRIRKYSKYSQVSKHSKSGRSNESPLDELNRDGKNSIPSLNRGSKDRIPSSSRDSRDKILELNKCIPRFPFTPSGKPSYNPRFTPRS